MKCKNCGAEFNEGIFCPECGTRVDEDTNSEKNITAENQTKPSEQVKLQEDDKRAEIETVNSPKKKSNGKGMAIASLIMGILSICSLGGLLIPEILGIVFAFKSKKGEKMSGIAKAGFICSVLSIIILVAIFVL